MSMACWFQWQHIKPISHTPKHCAAHANNSSMCYLLPFSLGNRSTDEADLYGIFGKTMTSWSYWKQLPWLHSINTIIQHPCNGLAAKQTKNRRDFLCCQCQLVALFIPLTASHLLLYLFMRNILSSVTLQ